MKVEVVSIGNELLAGDVVDTNAARLSQMIALRGVRVHRRQTVPDEVGAIVDAIALATGRSDLVLVSGGLGPTTDDLTTEAVARWMGVPLVLHQPSLDRIKQRFADRGLPCVANNEKQAYFPESAEILPNPVGTAPAFLLTRGGATVVCLPGVPHELLHIAETQIMPRLAPSSTEVRWRTLRTFGMTESAVGAALQEVPLPGVFIQYRASFPEILVTPVVQGPEAPGEALEHAVAAIRQRLGPHVYGEGDATLAVVVGELLRRRGLTLAVAESCTGGLLSHLVTRVPGSSDTFLFGAVTYANAAKEAILGVRAATLAEHGAVSEAVAREMVAGVRAVSGAAVGLAITGIAGPGGATLAKPVGSVHLALSVGDEPVVHLSRRFPGDRSWVQTLAAWTALDMVRRSLERI